VFKHRQGAGYRYSILFLLPALTIYLLFSIGPTVSGFYYSFTNWTALNSGNIRFIGLVQFKRLLQLDYLGLAIFNTILFTVTTTFFKLSIGLLLALVLNQAIMGRTILRGIIFTPTLINNIVLGLIFMTILAPSGLLNSFLKFIGLDFLAISWLAESKVAMYCVSFMEIWKWSGQMMLIFLAGLQGVPGDLYEAADIDGASSIQKFKAVTFPLIRPAFNINLLLSVIWGIRVFDVVFALTHGGPGRATETLNTIVFESLGKGFYGFGSAVNLIIVIIIVIISIPLVKGLRKGEVEL
jgi:raffinose/stachyose/melibiose transport system permease protein